MKIPSWWPHKENEPAQETRDLEKERILGRIGAMNKRIENLETQFAGIYDSACSMWGRIKSLENQMLWHEPVEKSDQIARAIREGRDTNDAGPGTTTIHMFGDEVELEEQLRGGKKKISRYAMKELKQRIKKK